MIRVLALVLLATQAMAGTNTLPVETGRIIQRQHVNKFQTALVGDIVPRDSSGVAADLGGSNGTTPYRWTVMTGKKLNLIQDAAGNAISLVSPAALASAYTLTLPPALPASDAILHMSSSGAVTALTVKAAQVSGCVDVSTTSSSSGADITGLTVTITTTGRPVFVAFESCDTTTQGGYIGCTAISNNANCFFGIYRDSTLISRAEVGFSNSASAASYWRGAPGMMQKLDVVGAGTYVYKGNYAQSGAGNTAVAHNVRMIAYEL